MEIFVNGSSRDVGEGMTVADLLERLQLKLPHVAVELNLEVVPRADFGATVLRAGDRLEVVTLVGGG